MAQVQQWIALLGRILLGLSFLGIGLSKIATWDLALKGLHSTPLEEAFTTERLPIFLAFSVLVEVIGGFLIVIGAKTRIAAALLAILTVVTLSFLKPFWLSTGVAYIEGYHAFVNDTIALGGLLLLLAYGSGGLSVDK